MKTEKDNTKRLNPKKTPLTVEVFRKLTKDENISDEQAEATITAIRTLVNIILEVQEVKECKQIDLETNKKEAA